MAGKGNSSKCFSQFIIGSNLYISAVSFIMSIGIGILFKIKVNLDFSFFVFFATLSSYSLHWYFTEFSENLDHTAQYEFRQHFNLKYKKLLLFLLVVSSVVCLYLLWLNKNWIPYIFPAIIATLFYTAPKLPIKILKKLEGKALIKTLHLSTVWIYITGVLPILLSGTSLDMEMILYLSGNYIFIYIICLLFDYRDQEQDKINYVLINNVKYIEGLLVFFALAFLLLIGIMVIIKIPLLVVLSILIPFLLLYSTLSKSITTKSDYWYYFVLDGLMCAPSIIAIIM
jgi:hypothetical protein